MDCWIVSDKDKASKDATILFTYQKNETGKKRSATIVVKSPDGKITKECRVEQDFRLVTIYWNDEQSGTFQKQCLANEVSTVVRYTIASGLYASYESKEAANELAKQALAEKGQAYANENAECIKNLFGNVERRCERLPECQEGFKPEGAVTYIVPAGKYTGDTQQEADQKAINDIHDNCQTYANTHGTCVEVDKYTGTCSKQMSLQKSDCAEGGVPKKMDFSVSIVKKDDGVYLSAPGKEEKIDGVSADAIVSLVGQDDANMKACEILESKVNDFAQRYINEHGVCVFTGKFSKVFTAQCPEGQTGSKLKVDELMVTGGPFTSEVSQEDANEKAKSAVEAQGQALANAMPNPCTSNAGPWYGTATVNICKSDCGNCETAGCSDIQFPNPSFGAIPQELYKSEVSQDDANVKAVSLFTTANQTQIQVSGQPMTVGAYIQSVYNKNSSCTPKSTNPDWVKEGEDFCENGKSYQNFKQNNPCCDNPVFGTIDKRLGGSAVCEYSAKGTATATMSRSESCGVCKKSQSVSITLRLSNDGQNAVFDIAGTEYPSGFTLSDITYVSNISAEDANQKANEKVQSLLSMDNEKTASFVNKNVGCDPSPTNPTVSSPEYECDGCNYISAVTYSSYCDSNGVEKPSRKEVSIVQSNSEQCDTKELFVSTECVGCTLYQVKRGNCSGKTKKYLHANNDVSCGEYIRHNEFRCEGCFQLQKQTNTCDSSYIEWKRYDSSARACGQDILNHNQSQIICDNIGNVYYKKYNTCTKRYHDEYGDLLDTWADYANVECIKTNCNGSSPYGQMDATFIDKCGKRINIKENVTCSVKNYLNEYQCDGYEHQNGVYTNKPEHCGFARGRLLRKYEMTAGYPGSKCVRVNRTEEWEDQLERCCYMHCVPVECTQGTSNGRCWSVDQTCKNESDASGKSYTHAVQAAQNGRFVSPGDNMYTACCSAPPPPSGQIRLRFRVNPERICAQEIQRSTWIRGTLAVENSETGYSDEINVPGLNLGSPVEMVVSNGELGTYRLSFSGVTMFRGRERHVNHTSFVDVDSWNFTKEFVEYFTCNG